MSCSIDRDALLYKDDVVQMRHLSLGGLSAGLIEPAESPQKQGFRTVTLNNVSRT